MHNVTKMFSARQVPWHKIGTVTTNVLKASEAITAGGLDWTVISENVVVGGNVVDGYKANVRSDNGKCLGIVSNRYTIVQNREAFDFMDQLTNAELEYETAGELSGGKSIFMTAKAPDFLIGDDTYSNYLVFGNAHDGTGAGKVLFTPTRVVCQNTFNLAIKTAVRSWSFRHIGDIKGKLDQAKMVLELANRYTLSLQKEGEQLLTEKIDAKYVLDFSSMMFPVNDEMSDRQKKNQLEKQTDIFLTWQLAPDLENIRDTKWGFVNAVSDYAGHAEPVRKTENYWENQFEKMIFGNGMALLDSAYEYVRER